MFKSECGTLDRVVASRTTAQQIDNFNKYLSFGHGRGRVAFEATEYRGKVGYFFINTSHVDGVLRECLCFSDGLGTQADIELLPFSPCFERVSIAKMKNVFGQFKREKIARQKPPTTTTVLTQIEEFKIKMEASKLTAQDMISRASAARKKVRRIKVKLEAMAIKQDCPRFSGV